MRSRDMDRILIVDDEFFICRLLDHFLTAEGYQCVVAKNGEEALNLIETVGFDLIITDIMMPGMSGIDLLNIVQLLCPDTAVLMVTAVDDRDTGMLAVELGAYGYVIKPFERNEILINVANALQRRRLTITPERGSNQRPALHPSMEALTRSPAHGGVAGWAPHGS